jgi:hypothetical protein
LLAALGVSGCFATTDRAGNVRFSLLLPEVLPPMVVVQPGVSVVTDLDQEIFYSDGYYWARQDDLWFRSRTHRGGWSGVQRSEVPQVIISFTPGFYVRHHPHSHGPVDEHAQRGAPGRPD